MGKLIDIDKARKEYSNLTDLTMNDTTLLLTLFDVLDNAPTVEAIPKDNVYKALQEIMKYEHEGFINISLARLDEILKKCEVSEDGNDTK